jgi:hypothetical protein
VSTAYICPEGLDVFSQYPHLSVDYFLKKAVCFLFISNRIQQRNETMPDLKQHVNTFCRKIY